MHNLTARPRRAKKHASVLQCVARGKARPTPRRNACALHHAQHGWHAHATRRSASALQCDARKTARPRREETRARTAPCTTGRHTHAARRNMPAHCYVLRISCRPVPPNFSVAPYDVRKVARPHTAAFPACRITDASALPAGMRQSPVRRESAIASQRAWKTADPALCRIGGFMGFFAWGYFFSFFTLSRTLGGMCFISSPATVPVAAPVAMAISTRTPM